MFKCTTAKRNHANTRAPVCGTSSSGVGSSPPPRLARGHNWNRCTAPCVLLSPGPRRATAGNAAELLGTGGPGCAAACRWHWVRATAGRSTGDSGCGISTGLASSQRDSGCVQVTVDWVDAYGPARAERVELRNLAQSIERRIEHLFTMTEADVLSKVHSQRMQIAPYSPVFSVSA